MVGQNIVFFNKIFTDLVMVRDGVVVVPVWCFLSICFSFINLGFVACYLISLGLDCDFYPLGF